MTSNLETIQQLYTAFANKDRQAILQLFAPDIEWIQNEGFPGGGRHVGATAVLDDVFARFRVEWEAWEAPVHEWLDAGHTIVALGEYRGKHKQTGKAMTAAFAHVYRLTNCRITKFQQFTDTAKITEAMR
jgi:uncharacterized protein